MSFSKKRMLFITTPPLLHILKFKRKRCPCGNFINWLNCCLSAFNLAQLKILFGSKRHFIISRRCRLLTYFYSQRITKQEKQSLPRLLDPLIFIRSSLSFNFIIIYWTRKRESSIPRKEVEGRNEPEGIFPEFPDSWRGVSIWLLLHYSLSGPSILGQWGNRKALDKQSCWPSSPRNLSWSLAIAFLWLFCSVSL